MREGRTHTTGSFLAENAQNANPKVLPLEQDGKLAAADKFGAVSGVFPFCLLSAAAPSHPIKLFTTRRKSGAFTTAPVGIKVGSTRLADL